MAFLDVSKFSSLGVDSLFWAVVKNGVPQGTSPTGLANGSAAGMARLFGVTGIDVTEPTGGNVVTTGDNGVRNNFILQPQEFPTGTITRSEQDFDFNAVANGVKVVDVDDVEFVGGFPACYKYTDLCFTIISPAISSESASRGQKGYVIVDIMLANSHPALFNPYATATPQEYTASLILNRASTGLSGKPFTSATDGSTSFAYHAYSSDYPMVYHTLLGNGSANTITLDYTPVSADANSVRVYKEGVKLAYTTDYTVDVATKVVTLVATPTAGERVVSHYKFLPEC